MGTLRPPEAVIAGVGHTSFGKHPGTSAWRLQVDAFRTALDRETRHRAAGTRAAGGQQRHAEPGDAADDGGR